MTVSDELSEQLSFRETKRIVEIIDRVAKNRGLQRTDIIRQAIRGWLASNSHLTDQEKKDLGVDQP